MRTSVFSSAKRFSAEAMKSWKQRRCRSIAVDRAPSARPSGPGPIDAPTGWVRNPSHHAVAGANPFASVIVPDRNGRRRKRHYQLSTRSHGLSEQALHRAAVGRARTLLLCSVAAVVIEKNKSAATAKDSLQRAKSTTASRWRPIAGRTQILSLPKSARRRPEDVEDLNHANKIQFTAGRFGSFGFLSIRPPSTSPTLKGISA